MNQPQPEPKNDIKSVIAYIANQEQVDPSLAISIAAVESGLNPNAKASTSSALGLYQFLDSTWVDLIKAYGTKHHMEELGLQDRTSPVFATTMFCELVKENLRYLTAKGVQDVTPTDLYLCHFLGPAGALKFIENQRLTPTRDATQLFPVEARANPGVYYMKDDHGNLTPRNLQMIYDLFTQRINSHTYP